MKIRDGFVSNSSSSSFICEFCNEEYSGWDACLEDAEMCQCVNGHTICTSHISDYSEVIEKLQEEDPTLDEYDAIYNIPADKCPICTFQKIRNEDAVRYLLKVHEMTVGDMKSNITDNFESYTDFKKFISS